MILLKILLASLALANIQEHKDWQTFAESSGIRYLQDKHHTTLICKTISDRESLCTLTNEKFEITYTIDLTNDKLSIVKPPEISHYQHNRYKACIKNQ